MVVSDKKNFIRWLIIIGSLISIGLFLWSVIQFFNQLKEEERVKMEIWSEALTELYFVDEPHPIAISIVEKNMTTPMILYSVNDDSYQFRNIPEEKVSTTKKMKSMAETFKVQYEPIEIRVNDELHSIVYYGNSSFINKTKYFPVLIFVVAMLLLSLLYFFYKITKSNDQNKLWAGMAKETAHQIGTPLSSLVGWTEILKTENVNPEYITEMERDVERLKTITDRFSKIGSVPTLVNADFVETVSNTFEYLKRRSSKLIEFSIEKPEHEIPVKLNEQLLSWTIENLVNNAADAVKGKGEIKLEIAEDSKWAYLWLSDSGKGISKRDFRKIFKPGETTKLRGWGLGLSLAKRIIEEYHQGKIKVLKSEIGQGSTFEIKLRKI